MDNKLTDQQKEALDEELVRASAFEELIRVKGWDFLKAYYQSKLTAFANGLLMNDKEKIESYESERQRLIGLRQLFEQIDNSLNVLEEFRKSQENAKENK